MLGLRYACEKHQQTQSREGAAPIQKRRRFAVRCWAWLWVRRPRPEQINSEARVGSAIEEARAQREDCQ
jgi:hypothetical protein